MATLLETTGNIGDKLTVATIVINGRVKEEKFAKDLIQYLLIAGQDVRQVEMKDCSIFEEKRVTISDPQMSTIYSTNDNDRKRAENGR